VLLAVFIVSLPSRNPGHDTNPAEKRNPNLG
jgi:hypothetical protein